MQLAPLRPRRRRTTAESVSSLGASAAASADLTSIAKRIAGLIDGPVTEAVVVMLTELYGDALSRIFAAIERVPAGAQILDELCADRLVGGLLVVHDLHPHPLATRVERAIAAVAQSAGQPLTLDRIEDDVVYVRTTAATAPTTRSALARAVVGAAPEISRVCTEAYSAGDRPLRC